MKRSFEDLFGPFEVVISFIQTRVVLGCVRVGSENYWSVNELDKQQIQSYVNCLALGLIFG